VAVSRLSDQSETLAQRQALLEERLRRQEEPSEELHSDQQRDSRQLARSRE